MGAFRESDEENTPQWSPPLNSGSTQGTAYGLALVNIGPPWSPPLTGGNTRELLQSQDRHGLPAMEPAGDQREDEAKKLTAYTTIPPQ